jgi:isoleucyl-tRNA synthetase
VSPILSFTAEEAWRELTKLLRDMPRSVFLLDFPVTNSEYILHAETLEKWEKILYVRKGALAAYEKLRQNKVIGSNLETSLNIKYGRKYNEIFKDLKLVNLTLGSWDIKCSFSDKEDDLFIESAKSEYEKCARCWRHIDNIKDGLCSRCREVIGK